MAGTGWFYDSHHHWSGGKSLSDKLSLRPDDCKLVFLAWFRSICGDSGPGRISNSGRISPE